MFCVCRPSRCLPLCLQAFCIIVLCLQAFLMFIFMFAGVPSYPHAPPWLPHHQSLSPSYSALESGVYSVFPQPTDIVSFYRSAICFCNIYGTKCQHMKHYHSKQKLHPQVRPLTVAALIHLVSASLALAAHHHQVTWSLGHLVTWSLGQ